MKITIASGKGGTGKTFVATNLAAVLSGAGEDVTYLDCDVEAPNGHLFLNPRIESEEDIEIFSPVGIDPGKCTRCGRCAEACTYNAIAVTAKAALIFSELCHVCGACTIVCPEGAVIEENKKIGLLLHGFRPPVAAGAQRMEYHYALLETGEGGMTPRLISRVKKLAGDGITLIDSPPGTACPAVAAVQDADLVVLVTDPTPFGLNDLKLAVEMCRKLGQEPVVLVNRAQYRDDSLPKYCEREKLLVVGEIPDDRAVAEVYSSGKLVVEELPEYAELFKRMAERLRMAGKSPRRLQPLPEDADAEQVVPSLPADTPHPDVPRPRELVVVSGKGGTGKTSVTASLAFLAREAAVSDCDVDAADLHLILDPTIEEKGFFSGGVMARILEDKCLGCGRCLQECRFEAILKEDGDSGREVYSIDPVACEGCGVCALVCPAGAVETEPAINGQWFVSRTRLDQPMTHARLGIAEENSGRLVTVIREKALGLAWADSRSLVLIDGSPGTGCPVIASLTGAAYALIVTEPTVSGIHDLKRILELTRHFSIPSGVVVNKHDLNRDKSEEIVGLAESYGAEMMGMIPYDRAVTDAQMEGLSVVEHSSGPAAQAVREIWARLNPA